ncbi:Aminoacylase-1 [Zancudomyces culisetae]|uniref:N-acyl-aliphatic-L-amino acid amidohydrolase n=1 Tax=Zancudomyces culisetae TaxID=1213189 RepID=A0A1R1PU86_ZANCU|nr:Aminoacylase-1 [Zancudomyces culisetae]|eukprot:OMH84462.1 Aminoacylase-1 [Zancudomyces culisetae]
MTQAEEPEPISRLRKYLQIKTVHPKPDYESCKNFLIQQAGEIGLEHQVVECVEGKPIVIIKLAGTDPTQKSILLSSHTDVVPVFEDQWKYDPFAAERVLEGDEIRIYARGVQDMKAQGMCYLEAFRILKRAGKRLTRNVYAIYAPDEEIGGADGVGALVETKEFEALNAGFDLDEGGLGVGDTVIAFTAERLLNAVRFTAHGNTGHGSQFIEGTAIEKLLPVMNWMLAFREEEKVKLNTIEGDRFLCQGAVTATNLTILEGGKQQNVVPATFSATFDMRVSPNRDIMVLRKTIRDFAEKHDVQCTFLSTDSVNPVTTWDSSDPFCASIEKVFEKRMIKWSKVICFAVSDARHIRRKGIPAIGINPLTNHPLLPHDHNEYVREKDFLEAIDVYVDLISGLANA